MQKLNFVKIFTIKPKTTPTKSFCVFLKNVNKIIFLVKKSSSSCHNKNIATCFLQIIKRLFLLLMLIEKNGFSSIIVESHKNFILTVFANKLWNTQKVKKVLTTKMSFRLTRLASKIAHHYLLLLLLSLLLLLVVVVKKNKKKIR